MRHQVGKLSILAMPTIVTFVALGAAYAFVPSTLFSMKVTSDVAYDRASHLFNYKYSVENAAGSQQDIKDVGISYDVEDQVNAQGPTDWEPTPHFANQNLFVWYYTGDLEHPIPPGTRKGGFSFQSKGLPKISTFYARSSYEYLAKDEAEMATLMRSHALFFTNNSQKAEVIGPGVVATDANSIISYLIDMKHKAYDRGWVTSQGIVTSLDKKLDAAQAALSRGQQQAALGQLGAFDNEVKAQTGKAINGQASSLLLSISAFVQDNVR